MSWPSLLLNLFVGWVHNPIIEAWNGFVDFHNSRVDHRNAQKAKLEEAGEGLSAEVDEKRYQIREHWFETDFLKVLSKATGQSTKSLKLGLEQKSRSKSPSKRR